MSYKLPPSLKMLDLYMRAKGVDLDSLKSARHALAELLRVSELKRRFPQRGQPTLPTMQSIHRELFPNIKILTRKRSSIKRGIGKIGPASKVRGGKRCVERG